MNTTKISTGYEWLLRRIVLILQAGLTALIWISMPSAIISLHLPLYYVGIVASIAIFSGVLIRLPLKIYLQRVGNNYFQSMCLVFNGLALIIISISSSILFYSFGFIIFAVSTSIFLLSVKVREYHGTRVLPLMEIFSVELWGTVGVFAILAIASLFSGPITQLYSVFSIVAIVIGLFGFFSKKDGSVKSFIPSQKIPVRNYLRTPYVYLKAFDSVKYRKVSYLIVASNLGIFTSLAMTLPFLSSLGFVDTLTGRTVFLAFAFFSVYVFLINQIPRKWINQSLGKMFYFMRPILLLLPLLVFSMENIQLLFIAGFALFAMWILLDVFSSGTFPVPLDEAEKDHISKIETVFRIPLSFLIPLLASYLWTLSPRFVFAFALIPISLSVIISFVFEDSVISGERNSASKIQRDVKSLKAK